MVRTIGTARTSVVVQAYSFTSVPIAQALIDAQKRGAKDPAASGSCASPRDTERTVARLPAERYAQAARPEELEVGHR